MYYVCAKHNKGNGVDNRAEHGAKDSPYAAEQIFMCAQKAQGLLKFTVKRLEIKPTWETGA